MYVDSDFISEFGKLPFPEVFWKIFHKNLKLGK